MGAGPALLHVAGVDAVGREKGGRELGDSQELSSLREEASEASKELFL
jgi:hypothetical protein